MFISTVVTGLVSAAPIFLGPTPYLSSADSPFAGQPFSYFYLEDFETGALTTPGVTITPGTTILPPSRTTDSVDGDDGNIDGFGGDGHSLYSAGSSTVRFTFDAAALNGLLPTHAGIVWTDVGFAEQTLGFGDFTFRAFGPANNLLGGIGPFALGDGDFAGQTGEDRFFGVTDLNGISAIEISTINSTDWEMDHLQYGAAAAPEPGTSALLLAGLGALLVRRHRQ
jgi:hypothetical protein